MRVLFGMPDELKFQWGDKLVTIDGTPLTFAIVTVGLTVIAVAFLYYRRTDTGGK